MKVTLTTEVIHSTADKLVEQGINPTLDRVREELGGGSFTTISKAMKAWRAEQQAEEELQQVELPNELSEKIQAMGATVWQVATSLANDRLANEREALDVARNKAQAEQAEAEQAVKILEEEMENITTRLNQSEEEKQSYQNLSSEQSDKAEKLQSELNACGQSLALEQERKKSALEQIKIHESEIDRLHTEQKILQEEKLETAKTLAKEQAKTSEQADKITSLQATLKDSKEQLKQAKANNKKLADKLEISTTEKNELSNKVSALGGEIKAKNERVGELQQKLDKSNQDNQNKLIEIEKQKLLIAQLTKKLELVESNKKPIS